MQDFLFIFIVFLIVAAEVVTMIFFIRRETRGLRESKNEEFSLREKNIELMQNQFRESSKIIKDVTSELERIHSDHRDVLGVKEQLDKLTDVLANPKQRGILGEYFLETLLKNVFQPHQYKLQYSFKDGETVDAVIFIRDKIIPIDSKFSLENYNRILEEKDLLKKEKIEKAFRQDLKNRIEETAKYIRPQEGTMDFAFMFIPSEGIYYDLLINQVGSIKSSTYDLIEYAFKEKHVIPVSPTSFYAYLQTVLQGLKALQIEESAKEIRKSVESLQKHLLNYNDFLLKLGSNLGTTVNAYNQAYKEFAKMDKDIVGITEGKKKIKPLELEKPKT